eukprot:gb/GECH01012030.1/.p1 GENE.gb/GECH01012030.1/~~gb/GECH01012030.1/.p1  ORF type:complete len:328 (+),score=83.35 gb/GECH01012030.1/:1-984(+)
MYWTQPVSSSKENCPPKRSSHISKIISVDGQKYLVVFGGEDVPRHAFDDAVYMLNLNTWEWEVITGENQETKPPAVVGTTGAVVGHELYIFGGRSNEKEDLESFYSFDCKNKTWQEIKTSSSKKPCGRSYHAMTSSDTSVFVFGGCSGQSGEIQRLNDLWKFDIESKEWVELPSKGSVPSSRGGALLVSLGGNTVYLYAGFLGHELDDMYCYDLETMEWKTVEQKNQPIPRSVCAGGALDHHRIIVFGGESAPSAHGHEGAGEYVNDVIIFDTRSGCWKHENFNAENQQPSPRAWFDGSVTPEGDRFIIFGGFEGNTRLNDLWVLNI